LEFCGFHVICVSAKARVPPACVYGIPPRTAQAAEPFEMNVGNALMLQRFGQRLTIELRITAGVRNRTDVDQPLDSMLLQQFDKFLDGTRGMADRQNRRRPGHTGLQIGCRFWCRSQSSCSAKQAVYENQKNDQSQHHVKAVLLELKGNDGK